MSYCRWSSLNGYCDVYVYEDVNGGWTTHVAGARRPAGAPFHSPHILAAAHGQPDHPAIKLYRDMNALWDAWTDANPPQPIDHPEAGKSFNHDTPGECAENLKRLAREGFIVPIEAIWELEEDERGDDDDGPAPRG